MTVTSMDIVDRVFVREDTPDIIEVSSLFAVYPPDTAPNIAYNPAGNIVITAGDVQAAIDQADSYLTNLTASQVRFVPAAGVAAVDVQGAIVELAATDTPAAIATAVAGILDGSIFTGPVLIPSGTSGNPGLGFAAEISTGFYKDSVGSFKAVVTGTDVLQFFPSAVVVNANAFLRVNNNIRDSRDNTLINQDLAAVNANRVMGLGNATYTGIHFSPAASNGGVVIGATPQFPISKLSVFPSAGQPGVIVKMAVTPTANPFEIRTSADAVTFRVAPGGQSGVPLLDMTDTGYYVGVARFTNVVSGGTVHLAAGMSTPAAENIFTGGTSGGNRAPFVMSIHPAADKAGLLVRGAAVQVGNLQEWQDSASAKRQWVDASGQSFYATSQVANQTSKITDLGMYFSRSTDGTYTTWIQSTAGTTPALQLQAQGAIDYYPGGGALQFRMATSDMSAPNGGFTAGTYFRGSSNGRLGIISDPSLGDDIGIVLQRGTRSVQGSNALVSFNYGAYGTAIAGMELARITTEGRLGLGTVAPAAMIHANISAASVVGQITRGAAAQTGDLAQWQDSAAAIVAKITAAGLIQGSSLNARNAGQGAAFIDAYDTTKAASAFTIDGYGRMALGLASYGYTWISTPTGSDLQLNPGQGVLVTPGGGAFTGLKVNGRGVAATVTNKALTGNVATITTAAAHGLSVGRRVSVAGVDATFNGNFSITATTATTFSYAKTAADVASVASAGSVAGDIQAASIESWHNGISETLMLLNPNAPAISNGTAGNGGDVTLRSFKPWGAGVGPVIQFEALSSGENLAPAAYASITGGKENVSITNGRGMFSVFTSGAVWGRRLDIGSEGGLVINPLAQSAAGTIMQVIGLSAGHTGNALEVRNSASTVLTKINEAGGVTSYDASTTGFTLRSAPGSETPIFQVLKNGASGAVLASPSSTMILKSGVPLQVLIDASNHSPGAIPIALRAHVSQTANLSEWQDSTGAVYSAVGPTGWNSVMSPAGVGGLLGSALFEARTNNGSHYLFRGSTVGGAQFGIKATNIIEWTGTPLQFIPTGGGGPGVQFTTYTASVAVAAFRGVASQTGDLTQWQDSASTVLARVTGAGYPRFHQGLGVGTLGDAQGQGSIIHVRDDGSATMAYLDRQSSTASAGIDFRRAMAGTTALDAANRVMGRLLAWGFDGGSYRTAAAIDLTSDAPFAAGSAPGRISFYTTLSATTGIVERVRIDNAGSTSHYPAVNANGVRVKNPAGATANGAPFIIEDEASSNPLMRISHLGGIALGLAAAWPSEGQVRMAGSNPGIYFEPAGALKWLFYTAGGSTMYFRDAVNSRMHETLQPGADANAAVSYFDSRVHAGTATNQNAQLSSIVSSPSTPGLLVKLAASATADALQIKDSADNPLLYVPAAGGEVRFHGRTFSTVGGDLANGHPWLGYNIRGAGATTSRDSTGTVAGIRAQGNFVNIFAVVSGTAGASITPKFQVGTSTTSFYSDAGVLNATVDNNGTIWSLNGLTLPAGVGTTYDNKWLTYSTGGSYFIRDTVNAVMAAQFTPGTSPTTIFNGAVQARAVAATDVPLLAKAAAAQTADLTQWQDSAGAVLSRVRANGENLVPYYTGYGFGATTGQYGMYQNGGASLEFLLGGAVKLTVGTNVSVTAGTTFVANGQYFRNNGSTDTYIEQQSGVRYWQIGVFGTDWKVRDLTGTTDRLFIASAGPTTVTPASASLAALVAKGAVSQTGNLQEWQNSAGTVLAKVDSTGRVFGNGFTGVSVSEPPVATLHFKAMAGQVAPTLRAENSGGASFFRVAADGYPEADVLYAADIRGGRSGLTGTNGALLTLTGTHSVVFNNGQNKITQNDPVNYSMGFYGADTAGAGGARLLELGATTQINARNAASIGLIVKGAVSQTGDLTQWQNSAGTVLAKVTASGGFASYGGPTYLGGELAFPGTGSEMAVYTTDAGAHQFFFDHRGGNAGSGWNFRNGATSMFRIDGSGNVTVPTASGVLDAWGQVRVGGLAGSGAPGALITGSKSASEVAFVARGFAGQTGDLLQIQNSAATVVARITASGAAQFTDIGPNRFVDALVPTRTVMRTHADGNLSLFVDTSGFGGGVGVVKIADATTVPTTNVAGGLLYSEGGALKWRGSAGTVSVLAPA
jgi:hypothetical protein